MDTRAHDGKYDEEDPEKTDNEEDAKQVRSSKKQRIDKDSLNEDSSTLSEQQLRPKRRIQATDPFVQYYRPEELRPWEGSALCSSKGKSSHRQVLHPGAQPWHPTTQALIVRVWILAGEWPQAHRFW